MYESYLRRMLGSSHPVSIKAACAAALKWFPAVHTSSDGDCRDIQVPGTLGVVEGGEIIVRPMMYLALSHDHRLIDGEEAVRLLVPIKELIEDPGRILLEV